MGTDNNYDGIDRYAVYLVKHKAKQLVGRVGFKEHDREDLEQDLMYDLLRRLSKYTSEIRNYHAFVTRIVNNKVARIMEFQKAGKRDYRMCTTSLNEEIPDDQGNTRELGQIIDLEEYLHRVGKTSRSIEELQELIIDVEQIMDKLPPEVQDVCERLAEETPTEIAHNIGKSRMTVYRYIKRIREVFEDLGLRDYL